MKKSCAIVSVFLLTSSLSLGATKTFVDNGFQPTDWDFRYLDIGGSTGNNSFCMPNGSCATFERILSATDLLDVGREPFIDAETILAPSDGTANVQAILENKSARWDPVSDGAIKRIDWSVDIRILSRQSVIASTGSGLIDQNLLDGMGVQALIMQDGIAYSKRLDFACDRVDDQACMQWHDISRSFDNFAFSALGNPTAPLLDLTSGSPVTFGLVVASSGNHTDTRANIARGLIDNWRVTVHTVPEPNTMSFLPFLLLSLPTIRRLR